jgi:hypothetical protein
MWRRAGVPKDIAPPRGSWLDLMFERHQIAAVWSDRLDAAHVERWAALRRDRDEAGHYNLMHDRELARLRDELEARQWYSGIGRIIGGLKDGSKSASNGAQHLTRRANHRHDDHHKIGNPEAGVSAR